MLCPMCLEKGIKVNMSARQTIPVTYECGKCYCWVEQKETTDDKIAILKAQLAALESKKDSENGNSSPSPSLNTTEVINTSPDVEVKINEEPEETTKTDYEL